MPHSSMPGFPQHCGREYPQADGRLAYLQQQNLHLSQRYQAECQVSSQLRAQLCSERLDRSCVDYMREMNLNLTHIMDEMIQDSVIKMENHRSISVLIVDLEKGQQRIRELEEIAHRQQRTLEARDDHIFYLQGLLAESPYQMKGYLPAPYYANTHPVSK